MRLRLALFIFVTVEIEVLMATQLHLSAYEIAVAVLNLPCQSEAFQKYRNLAVLSRKKCHVNSDAKIEAQLQKGYFGIKDPQCLGICQKTCDKEVNWYNV